MQTPRNLSLIALFFFALTASAQVLPDPVQYVVYPETPGPRETVSLEVQGVGSFLGSADIVWRRDGTTVLQGVGERKFSFTTGALGERTIVSVQVDSDQGRFSKTFTFNPAKVNLVWEADTTVPPLYRGKARYSAGSSYKVVAFPSVYVDGARVLSSALDFQWFYRDESVPDASGRGRGTFSRAGDQLQPVEQVAVDIYYGNKKVARGELIIPISEPQIVFYPYDPLQGPMYERALPAGISLLAPELTVRAEPYFFSKAASRETLPFAWTLGGEEISGPDTARGLLTLRQTGSGEGSVLLGASIQNQNPAQFVQTAEAFLQIVFGAEQPSSLLDLFRI